MAGGIFRKLSDKAVKAFVTKAAPGKKLSDGGGLYLFIPPTGSANWRIKYRIEGKEKVFSVGPYPLVRRNGVPAITPNHPAPSSATSTRP
jgi:hypothetical protein